MNRICESCNADFNQQPGSRARACCSDACYKAKAAAYQREKRHQAKELDHHTPEALDAFMAQVFEVKSGPHAGCWQWTGNLFAPPGAGHTTGQYGRFYVPGTYVTVYAHRWSYEQFVGPVKPGEEVDHMCHNDAAWCRPGLGVTDCAHRRCVRPEHLVAATSADNNFRGDKWGRYVTHCLQGHAYDEANTYLHHQKNGRVRRHCRTCMRDRNRQRALAARGA